MIRNVRWRRLWIRLRRDWPGKLGAVLAALVVWWVASSEPVPTTQRSMLVPLEVVGAADDEVAVGVPARVEVIITGPSERMESLRASDVDATLDLADFDGEFESAIGTRVPQRLEVTRVVPAEVIGRLEAVRRADFDVRPRIAPADDGRVLTDVTLTPATVSVEARDPILALVAQVIAPVASDAPDASDAVPMAIDEEGRPLPEARVVPATVRVELQREARRTSVVRPVSLGSLDDPAVTVDALLPTQVTLIGPPERLADLPAVPATVPAVTTGLAPGRYDLPVRLDLPEGVAAVESVQATIRIAAPGGEGASDLVP